MSPPIYTPDGTEVSEIVLPDGSTASEVIGPDGNVVFEAGPDIPDSVLTQDLVAWYRFEDGDARDYTNDLNAQFADSTAFDGTVNGATFQSSAGITDFENGANSGAFDFDGNDNITTNTLVNPGLPCTIMGYAKYDTANGIIVFSVNSDESKDDSSIGLVWNDADEFAATSRGGGGVRAATTPVTGQYFHVAGVFRDPPNGDVDIYIDGQLDNNGAASDEPGTTSLSNTNIGARNSDPDFYNIIGTIDDVRIYNTELSGQQILDIYNATEP